MREKNISEAYEQYGKEMTDGALKYLSELKSTNRKAFNKINKQGRKFSDNIMKILK